MRPLLVRVLLVSFFLLKGADVSALTITADVRAQPGGAMTVVRLTGMFEKGDAVELRKTLVRLRTKKETVGDLPLATAELSSQGGDVFEGVKIGSGSGDPAPSPAGSGTPQTVPLRRYSASPDPASQPRTTHSKGITSA